MTINIEQSFLTEKALDYAKLSQLAYAIWTNGVPSENASVWQELFDRGYRFVDYTNDPLTGFSATIFQKDGQNILAIRGTEKKDPRDLWADGELIRGQLPAYQYESMVNYINEKMLTNYDVTGHSLGGCLAQAAKATFVDWVMEGRA